MEHKAQDTHFKWELTLEEPPRSFEARRIPCSCGWVGEWQKDAYFACAAFERHVEQRIPLRDCGHAFTHVGLCLLCPDLPVETL